MFSVWLKLSGLHSLLKLKKWNYLQKEGSTYFKGNIIITFGIDDKWDAYLMDVFKYVKHNDGVAFILVVIDMFFKVSLDAPLDRQEPLKCHFSFYKWILEGRHPNQIRARNSIPNV